MKNRILALLLCSAFSLPLISCSSTVADTTAASSTAIPDTQPATTAAPVTTAEPITTAAPETELTLTGKKYFTMSFDDGIEQDERFIQLLKKYNIPCCTFFVNTGLLGQKGNLKAMLGKSVEHNKISRNTFKDGFYNGYDVEVHTLSHPALTTCADAEVIRQVTRDAQNIKNYIGTTPIGMAYPGGNYYNDHIIDLILNNSDIRYARTITSTYKFDLPERFMEWNPTVCASDSSLMSLARRFVNNSPKEDEVMLFFVWGHTYEFDFYESWDKIEDFLSFMSGHDDIVYVTTAEFYRLFSDVVPS